MAIVVTGPNNYVGMKANKIHPLEGKVLDEGWLAKRATEPEREGGKWKVVDNSDVIRSSIYSQTHLPECDVHYGANIIYAPA